MTLEQQRAAMAYAHVQKVPEKADQKIYGSMAQKLPALIRTAGLCQALYFVKSRGKKPLETFLGHLAEQLKRVDPQIADMDKLLERVRDAKIGHYVWLTREALASVGWYARLARSEWGILPGEDNDK